MKKGIRYVLAMGLLGIMTATNSIGAESEVKKPSTEAPAKEKKPAHYPFHGKLTAVDKAAMTITVAEKGKTRTVHITSHTRISKSGKPATLSEAVIGDEIAGQAIKNSAGEENAATVRLGAKTNEKASEKKEKRPTEKKKE